MQVNERASPIAHESVDTSVVWYLSFGDLLTLLLCFFLVLTPSFQAIDNDRVKKEVVSATPGPSKSPGTALATMTQVGVGVPPERIAITVSATSSVDGSSLVAELLSAWRAHREHSKGFTQDVTFRLCALRGGEDLMASLSKERHMLGQLVRKFQIEPFAECDATSLSVQPERELVAILEISKV